jgi:hypothetical protein
MSRFYIVQYEALNSVLYIMLRLYIVHAERSKGDDVKRQVECYGWGNKFSTEIMQSNFPMK